MATITKRGDSWRVQVRRTGHKPLSKTFSKKVHAEKWAREMETAVEAGQFHGNDPDVGAVIQRYVDEVLPIRPVTRTTHASYRGLRHKMKGVKVSEIKPQWMLDWCSGMDIQPSTRLWYFTLVHSALTHAEAFWDVRPDWDSWRRGITMLRKMGVVAATNRRERRCTDDEIDQVMNVMSSTLPMEDLIQFAVDTCMRLGEMCRLRWDDLDTRKRTVVIRDRKHPSRKVGNHQTIPLLGRSYEIIKRQVKQSELIFPYKAGSVEAAWIRAVKSAGLKDLRWHDLRHEGISRLFEQGYSIVQVAMVSGHTDLNMLKRYTHLKPESLHEGPLKTE